MGTHATTPAANGAKTAKRCFSLAIAAVVAAVLAAARPASDEGGRPPAKAAVVASCLAPVDWHGLRAAPVLRNETDEHPARSARAGHPSARSAAGYRVKRAPTWCGVRLPSPRAFRLQTAGPRVASCPRAEYGGWNGIGTPRR